jgi:hypothetical protein
MTKTTMGQGAGGKEINPLVVIGLSKAILSLPMSDEQLHAAVRNYSRRMAGFQNEQLDSANPAFRVETQEQKERRLRVYEAHGRIDDFNDFQRALKEFKELYAEGVNEENVARLQIRRLREREEDAQKKQDAAELLEMSMKEREGALLRELDDLKEQKEALRRAVMRTDLQLLLDEEKRKSLRVRARLDRSRKLNRKQDDALNDALLFWLCCGIGRSKRSGLLEWQSVFSARRMTVLEFSLSHSEKARSAAMLIMAEEKQKEDEILRELSPSVRTTYTQCLDRLTRMVQGNRGALTHFNATLKSYSIENGMFISKHIPASTGRQMSPERFEYERVMGSIPLDKVEKSNYADYSRLPARFAIANSLPFLIPGHLLISQRTVEFTPGVGTYEELFESLKNLRQKSAFHSQNRTNATASNRILIDVG